MSLTSRILPLLALALLTACILVDDFGGAWSEAKADPCINKIASSLYAGEFNRDPSAYEIEDLARSVTWEGENFLLLKQAPEDKGGRLYKFRVTNGIFERFRLVPTMRAKFEKEYPNAPVSLKRDTVTLANLDKAPKDLLIAVAKKAEYWEAEDKTLYNTIRNPTCRFEDRDLKALDKNLGKQG